MSGIKRQPWVPTCWATGPLACPAHALNITATEGLRSMPPIYNSMPQIKVNVKPDESEGER